MNDSAKMSLEREINRKLDALKEVIEDVMRYDICLARVRSRAVKIFEEAWKEEEEVQRES